MDYYSSQISKLIEELSRLPGIGAKSAGRLAFHIINMPKEQVEQLAATLVDARNNVRYCKQCFARLLTKNYARSVPARSGIIRRSWLWKIPEILRLMKRLENITVCTMYFMAQFPRCLGSDLEISG